MAAALQSLAGGEVDAGQRLPLVAEDARAAAPAARGAAQARSWRGYAGITWSACRAKAAPAISIPAAASDVDYVVLNELPFARSGRGAGQSIARCRS